ncbi:sulfotransferase [soil metagenome]
MTQGQPFERAPSDRSPAPVGILPNFLVIVAPRCGTSSLARYRRVHPEVFLAVPKELRFFDREFDRGLGWYRERFAAVDGERAVGEASPSYLYRAEAVERMATTVPHARLIAILRDPVARAYSHYWMERMRGRERRSFAEAVDAELGPGAGVSRSAEATGVAYLDRGRYLSQLERVGEHYPRSSLLVLVFDDVVADPAESYRKVCRFLAVSDTFVPPLLGTAVNPSVAFRSLGLRRLAKQLPDPARRVVERVNTRSFRYPPLDPGLRARATAYLEDDTRALGIWLDRDLSSWMA